MKRIVAFVLSISLGYFSHAAKVDTIQVFSNAMHKNIKCVVAVPDSYGASAQETKKYPVVYLLHGYSGNYANWSNSQNLIKGVDQQQIIAVCPDGGFGSWYFDSPKDSTFKYETFVSKELVKYIDEKYHTIADRKGRAIAGLSMGGHGALFLAIKHQDVYGAAASMSGGVDYTPFPNNWDIAKRLGKYEDNKQLWEENTVYYLVQSLKNKALAISFECGVDDFFIGVNRKLHERLLQLKIDHDYAERPGEHNWPYWNNAIQYQLIFFKNYFNKG